MTNKLSISCLCCLLTSHFLRRLIDINDNAPNFTESTFFADPIHENTAVGGVVFTALASDRDLGLNADIRYTLHAPTVPGLLSIDETSGAVSLLAVPDFETVGAFANVTIRASDIQGAGLSTDVRVSHTG